MNVSTVEELSTKLLELDRKDLKMKWVFRHFCSWDLHMSFRLDVIILKKNIFSDYTKPFLPNILPTIPVRCFSYTHDNFNHFIEDRWSFSKYDGLDFWSGAFKTARWGLLETFNEIFNQNNPEVSQKAENLLTGCFNHTETHLHKL